MENNTNNMENNNENIVSSEPVKTEETVNTSEEENKEKSEYQDTTDLNSLNNIENPELDDINKKKKVSNKTVLIIAIVVMVLIFGWIWVQRNKKENIIGNQETVLSREDATSLIKEKVTKIIDIYERKEEVFKVADVEDSDYLFVTNYHDIVDRFFTENGLKELENTKFGNDMFVVERGGKMGLLIKIPDENKYTNSSISVSKFDIKENQISAEVTLTTYAMKEDVLTYYVIVKNIKLIKNENNWLVDSFSYPN